MIDTRRKVLFKAVRCEEQTDMHYLTMLTIEKINGQTSCNDHPHYLCPMHELGFLITIQLQPPLWPSKQHQDT